MDTTQMKIPNNEHELFSQYPYIYAWGYMLGSSNYYIANQCTEAKFNNVSSEACYYNTSEARWVLKSELRPALQEELEGFKYGS
jgi:hypothetical protein